MSRDAHWIPVAGRQMAVQLVRFVFISENRLADCSTPAWIESFSLTLEDTSGCDQLIISDSELPRICHRVIGLSDEPSVGQKRFYGKDKVCASAV